MGDVFKEQIVKREPRTIDSLKRAGIIILVIIVIIIAFMVIPGFAPVIAVAAGFGAYMLMGFLNIEYEYVFTNGDLDIDIIYNRSRRKRLMTVNMKEIEVMAHIDDKVHAGDFNSAQETLDYSSGIPNENTYAFLTTFKSKKVKVIIEPNEKLMTAIAGTVSRRKIFLRK